MLGESGPKAFPAAGPCGRPGVVLMGARTWSPATSSTRPHAGSPQGLAPRRLRDPKHGSAYAPCSLVRFRVACGDASACLPRSTGLSKSGGFTVRPLIEDVRRLRLSSSQVVPTISAGLSQRLGRPLVCRHSVVSLDRDDLRGSPPSGQQSTVFLSRCSGPSTS